MRATELIRVCHTLSDLKAAASYLGHSPSTLMNSYAENDGETIKVLMHKLENKNHKL